MSTWFVDTSLPYSSTGARAGTAYNTCFYGIGGFLRALYSMAAGETLNVKYGTTLIGKNLVSFTVNTHTGSIAIGETVTQATTGATGTVCYSNGGTWSIFWVEQGAASAAFDGTHQLTASGGGTMTPSARTLPCLLATVDGSATYRVKIIGVTWDANGNITNDGTQVVIDATSGTGSGFTGRDWMWLENIKVINGSTACASHGINWNGRSYGVLINCHAQGAGAAGIDNLSSSCFAFQCSAVGNSTHGFRLSSGAIAQDCYAYNNGNGSGGFSIGGYSFAISCVSTGNGWGFYFPTAGNIMGCTADGNSSYGVNVTAGDCVIQRSRITNNTTAGIQSNGSAAWSNANVFYHNGGDADGVHTHDIGGTGVVQGPLDTAAANVTECGYVASASRNYALTEAAIQRRVTVLVGGVGAPTTEYRSVGPIPNDVMTSVTGVLKTDVAANVGSILVGTSFGSYATGGTFNEAARNADPGVSYVIAGHDYKIQNVSKTAAFDLTADRAAQYASGEAAQLVADKASVTGQAAGILNTYTILTIPGTFDIAADRAAAAAAQLVEDRLDVTNNAASILTTATILDVVGTYDETVNNTDPGRQWVLWPHAYKIYGENLIGTLGSPDPAAGMQGAGVALADEVVAALNIASLCLPIAAVRRFVRVTHLSDIPKIGAPVAVDVFPGVIESDRIGVDGMYDDLYGIHIVIQQGVADATSGGLSETQVALLLKLQSQIVEFLCSKFVTATTAVHPFSGARVMAVRLGDDGIYSLPRLEIDNAFYCDTILTYKAAGLRRRTN